MAAQIARAPRHVQGKGLPNTADARRHGTVIWLVE
jgi:hypothetical protein